MTGVSDSGEGAHGSDKCGKQKVSPLQFSSVVKFAERAEVLNIWPLSACLSYQVKNGVWKREIERKALLNAAKIP